MAIEKQMIGAAKMEEQRSVFEKLTRILFAGILIVFFAFFISCENPGLKANKPAPTAEKETTPFERDLETMRTANFDYIYVFRRKDGNVFDGEDKKYLRANAPAETNRFVSTDDGKAFIAGSSFKFTAQHLENLAKRFNIENFSTIKDEPTEEKPSPSVQPQKKAGNKQEKK